MNPIPPAMKDIAVMSGSRGKANSPASQPIGRYARLRGNAAACACNGTPETIEFTERCPKRSERSQNDSNNHRKHQAFGVHIRPFCHLEGFKLMRHDVFSVTTSTEEPKVRENCQVIWSDAACSQDINRNCCALHMPAISCAGGPRSARTRVMAIEMAEKKQRRGE